MAEEWKIPTLARTVDEILKEDRDWLCVIAGGEGSGKSTLAQQLNKKINMATVGKYNIKDNTLFYPTTEEISDIYVPENRYRCYQWDEAIRVLYKLDWANTKSKAIVKDFAVNRAMNIGTILCLPRMRDLNENFRNWRVTLWGEVVARGVCVWFSRDPFPQTDDPWHWYDNTKIIERASLGKRMSQLTIEDIVKILAKCKGFEAITYFDKSPEDEWSVYKALKEEKRTTLLEMSERNNKARDIALNMLNSGLNVPQIAKMTGLQERMLYKVRETMPNYVKCPIIKKVYNSPVTVETPPKSG